MLYSALFYVFDLSWLNIKKPKRKPVFLTYNLIKYVLISYHGYYTYIYSRLNILIMVGVVWAFSFGMILPPLLEVWGTLGLDKATFSCTILK